MLLSDVVKLEFDALIKERGLSTTLEFKELPMGILAMAYLSCRQDEETGEVVEMVIAQNIIAVDITNMHMAMFMTDVYTEEETRTYVRMVLLHEIRHLQQGSDASVKQSCIDRINALFVGMTAMEARHLGVDLTLSVLEPDADEYVNSNGSFAEIAMLKRVRG